jgi:hypothetical protein
VTNLHFIHYGHRFRLFIKMLAGSVIAQMVIKAILNESTKTHGVTQLVCPVIRATPSHPAASTCGLLAQQRCGCWNTTSNDFSLRQGRQPYVGEDLGVLVGICGGRSKNCEGFIMILRCSMMLAKHERTAFFVLCSVRCSGVPGGFGINGGVL